MKSLRQAVSLKSSDTTPVTRDAAHFWPIRGVRISDFTRFIAVSISRLVAFVEELRFEMETRTDGVPDGPSNN
jgi:hypothetical protein